MAGCLDCLRAGRPSTRIRDDIPSKCYKNRTGACPACQKLVDLNRKIDAARHDLQLLLDEKEAMASVINEHHDPFARLLPVEIATGILVHCKPQAPSAHGLETDYDEGALIRNIFNPTHANKNWRNISHATPHIWTTLCMTVNRTNCISLVSIVRGWLTRSRGLPLTVRLCCRTKDDDSEDTTFALGLQKVMACLAQHSRRWEGLILLFRLPKTFFRRAVKVLSTTPLDNLKNIKLDFEQDTDDNDGTSFVELNASPQCLSVPSAFPPIKVSFHNLKHFYTCKRRVGNVVRVFQSAHELMTCHLGQIVGPPLLQTENPVVAQSLTTLILTSPFSESWDLFTLPSLDTLHTVPDVVDPQCWVRLESLIRRSGCHLRELKVTLPEDRAVALSALGQLFRLTPDLKHLRVVGYIDAESLFSEMDDTATPREMPFLPKLASLHFRASNTNFEWSWLIALLTTLTLREECTLREVQFFYDFRHKVQYAVLLDKTLFKHILAVVGGLQEFGLHDHNGHNLVEFLRRIHDL